MDTKGSNKKTTAKKTEPAPHSITAERALLSSVLIDDSSLNKILQDISSDDFYDVTNRTIFTAMEKLYQDNQKVDIVSVENLLRINNENIDYVSYLIELFQLPEGLLDYSGYIRIIKQKSVLRKLGSLFESSIANIKTAVDPYPIIYDVENNLAKIIDDSDESRNYKLSDVVDNYIHRDTKITGIQTGFKYLDELTTGFQNSNLIIIAARPSIGKTALALKIALNMANQGKHIAFFTIEMSKEQIAERAISLMERINSKDLRKGNYEKDVLAQNVLSKTENMGVYINDTTSVNIVELKAKIKQLKKEKQIDIAFIDYLQLIKPINSFTQREQAISDISRGLKAIAKELDMPIVALAQLNRLVEARSDKKPQLADLRESGSIEQDADVVMMIHRPGFYEKNKNEEYNNDAEIIIVKQRNGATGVVNLAFIDEFSSFEERALIDDDACF